MSDLLASALVIEPETAPCQECGGRGFTTYITRETDGSEWFVSRDCHACRGIGRVLRDGTPIERKRGIR